jgi:hypothetical protein
VRITGKVVKLMGYEFFGQLRTMTSSVVWVPTVHNGAAASKPVKTER